MRLQFDKEIRIGKHVISEGSKTFVIAEAGVNHGGDIDLAKQMVDLAREAGVDAVKFQAFRTERLILAEVEKAPYQKHTTQSGESQFEMLKRLELRKDHYLELKNYCEARGLVFLITPFDEQSLEELEEIGVAAYKIASTDTTNLLFLRKVAKTGKPVILSTGMCDLDEVRAAVEEIHPYNKRLILLQCTANYPIMDNEANLNVLETFKQNFDVVLGYSDHSVGLGAAPYAVPMGARVIEKHFTISKDMEGPDHRASLDPSELRQLVSEIRRIEVYMGGYEKKPTDSEMLTKKSLQKCLVAAKPIRAGETITEDHLVAKRTGGKGISPIHYRELVGKPAPHDFKENEIIDVE